MTVSQPKDLTVARSDVAAELIAAAVWEAVDAMEGDTATAEATRRLLRRHAHELLELHNVKADEVLTPMPSQPLATGTPGYIPGES